MDCFENVIGLTNKECPCYEGKPEDAGTSDTGLILDELDGLPLDFATAAEECGEEGGLWSKMIMAKKTAIIQTSQDLLACIAKNNVLELKGWAGYVGENGFKNQLTIDSSWAGMKLVSHDHKSTYLKINAMSLMLSESGSFEVLIYNNRDSAAIASYTIEAVANRLSTKKIDSPVNLPLFDDGFGPLNYYIVYQPGTAQPKDSKVSCGCGNKEEEIKKYLTAYGMLGSIVDDFDQRLNDNRVSNVFKTTTSYSYGLSLSVAFECDQREIICKNYEQDINFKQYFGQAVLYKAAENLLNYILNSSDINIYTQTSREGLYGRRNSFRKEYVDHLSYLCGVVDLSKTACFKCKKRIQVSRNIS